MKVGDVIRVERGVTSTAGRRFLVEAIDDKVVRAWELEGQVTGKLRYFDRPVCHVDRKATKIHKEMQDA